MPVPGSGELELRGDINNEVNDNTTDNNVSLKTLSDDAGFDSAPYAMSEFYDYTNYITPTVTQATTGNVYDTQMKLYGTVRNENSGNNTQYGWYFGTDSTMTNNTFIHDGNTNGSTSTINFDYTKTGLSASTTYYIWTVNRDLSGNVLASAAVKTQATQADPGYSTYTGGTSINVNGQSSDGAYYSVNSYQYYDHVYYGMTQHYGISHSGTGPSGAWNAASSNIYHKMVYKSGGATTQELRGYCRSDGTAPGGAEATVTYNGINCSPSGPSNFSCTSGVSSSGSTTGSCHSTIGWSNSLSGWNRIRTDCNSGNNGTITRKMIYAA